MSALFPGAVAFRSKIVKWETMRNDKREQGLNQERERDGGTEGGREA